MASSWNCAVLPLQPGCCEPQGQMALHMKLGSAAYELHGLFMYSFLLSPGFLISETPVNHPLCQGWV